MYQVGWLARAESRHGLNRIDPQERRVDILSPVHLVTYDAAKIEDEQKKICARFTADFLPCPRTSKLGIALSTLSLLPLNGLRHVPERGTSGWYIWGGELLARPDFFEPLHVGHVAHRCPEILKFMGLPAGYRFLLAGDHIDVWFDVNLLSVSAP